MKTFRYNLWCYDAKETKSSSTSSLRVILLAHLTPVIFYLRMTNAELQLSRMLTWEFPGDPVAKTLYSQCRGPEFDPWPGNQIPHTATKSSHAAIKGPAGLTSLLHPLPFTETSQQHPYTSLWKPLLFCEGILQNDPQNDQNWLFLAPQSLTIPCTTSSSLWVLPADQP